MSLTTVPYVTLDEANAYFSQYVDNDKWSMLSADTKVKLINNATAIINSVTYIGSKTFPLSTNEFPRTYTDNAGLLVIESVVSDNVKEATMIEALNYSKRLQSGERIELQMQGVTSIKTLDYTEVYSGKIASTESDGLTLKSINLLSKYSASVSSSVSFSIGKRTWQR